MTSVQTTTAVGPIDQPYSAENVDVGNDGYGERPRLPSVGVTPSGTLFRPGQNCFRVARAARASVVIDADAYFKAFAQAALRATHSVVIVGWDFHSRTRLHHGLDGVPDLLGDFLNFLVKRRRTLNVYILTWDYSVLFAKGREPSPTYGLGWHPHRRVHFCYDSNCPFGSAFHQKLTVIDGAVAFCGGLDLTRGRWDTPLHDPHDPRRTNEGETEPYAPFHDVMWLVDGDVARTLYELASDRWMRATGKSLPRLGGIRDPWPDVPLLFADVDLAIARTLPEYEDQRAVTEVQTLYLDMIAAARRYIYLENQYFTSRVLGEALAARLREPDGPEVVAVLRLRSHGWLEAPTMSTLRTVLLGKLREADRYGRFHACYTYIPDLPADKCCDLHTKLMIVDDEWLRVGSANFANRSMGLDTECDLVLEARGDPVKRQSIAAVRDRLLAEHLDLPTHVIEDQVRRMGSVASAVQTFAHGSGRTLRYFKRLDEPSDAMVAVASGIADRDRPVTWNELITGFVPEADLPPSHWGQIGALSTLGVLLVIAALWRYTPLSQLTNVGMVIQHAQVWAQAPWAAVVAIAAYTPAALTLFPRAVLTLFSVVAFGPWLGFGYALCGILISAVVTYALGTRLDVRRVRQIAGRRLTQVAGALRQRGVLAMTALRLLPIAPFVVINVVAGAIRIRPVAFVLGTACGILPGTLGTTIFADQLLLNGLQNPRSRHFWLTVAVLTALVAITALAHRLLGARSHGRLTRSR